MNSRSRALWRTSAMFAAFITVFLTVFWQASHGSDGILSGSEGNLVYYINAMLFLPGFASFSLACRVLRSRRARAVISAVVLAAAAASGAALYAFKTPFVYKYVSPVAVFALCFIGAGVYHRISCESSGRGLALGVGFSAGLLIQYFLQGNGKPVLPLLLVVGAAFAALCYFTLRPIPGPEASRETAGGKRSVAVLIVCAFVVTCGMFIVTAYYNGYIHELSVRSGFSDGSAMSWPRLVLIPSYLLFGFVGELRGGKYVPFAALIMILLSVPGALHASGESAYYFNMCLFYVGIAAVNSYHHLTFWALAPRTAHPKLWASAGRWVDGVATGIMGLTGFSNVPIAVVLVIDVLCLAGMITALLISGSLPSRATAPAADPAAPADGAAALSSAEAVDSVRRSFSLTAQEGEVFSSLVTSEDKQDAIAASLGISVNTLRHHITAIYKKTGVQTRSGLQKLYHDAGKRS